MVKAGSVIISVRFLGIVFLKVPLSQQQRRQLKALWDRSPSVEAGLIEGREFRVRERRNWTLFIGRT